MKALQASIKPSEAPQRNRKKSDLYFNATFRNAWDVNDEHLALKFWNICTCANCDYSLLHIICKCPDMIQIWNWHWGFSDKINFDQWFHQLDHVTFSKNRVLVCKLHTALFSFLQKSSIVHVRLSFEDIMKVSRRLSCGQIFIQIQQKIQ